MKRNSRNRKVKTPLKLELALYLIREQLKSDTFFKGLQKVGIYDVHLQVNLDIPILKLVGVSNCSDELLTFFLQTIESTCNKILDAKDSTYDKDLFAKYALKVYRQLKMKVRSKRKLGVKK